ncbi:MAG: flagellar export chaperone FliS [Candidatus Accumulibacter sp.]|uniref:flagellar export chaperone FliS n=1 Tax=Accumulibacter sp. TaxID=2053492 RepID=UPI002878BD2A|nr:flagellar export chaperone FliS [Accumulibacter sp.]MDS4013410.1 flagellar export chaperone FliS [Accumulibacter sp.]
MFSSPIAAYQQVDRESDIRGADPHRLIMLLFDGAIAALDAAERHMNENNIAEKSNSIAKAASIVSDGLSASLNIQAGGELAQNLAALYDYMVRRLMTANTQNDLIALREVRSLLQEIGGAWRDMGDALGRGEAAKG